MHVRHATRISDLFGLHLKQKWSISAGIELEDNMYAFLKLFVLLYADDTVILAESASDQNALDTYALYCETGKLKSILLKQKY